MKLLQKIFLISSKFLYEINTEQFLKFLYNLECKLLKKYEQHWYPNEPNRGNGFRSLQVDTCQVDPLLIEAANQTQTKHILSYLPREFTIWIDPKHVSYRFKESGDIVSYFKIENNASSNRLLWPGSDVIEVFTANYTSCKSTAKQRKKHKLISAHSLNSSHLITTR